MRKLNKVNTSNNNTVEAYKVCICVCSCSCKKAATKANTKSTGGRVGSAITYKK